ncbi:MULTISPECIES: FAD/NAD(P)-binding protein [unclassified Leeuwenhoekiella]|uniref:FAD/NAD(P)-binding protein n=1 Tax=unclassified Leeuwenhoekiella TaxID=2615029 RepID=UPI000C5FF6BB|nr:MULTISPECIES: FAD/NAD(P)-binding protein [unclassified Leeuwenhoekiella]MAW97003.1 hypothetical protein [Leeuwenhoekiella sp.]MBA80715.1 hypothetical protein [Leeuwenhoekiella sp.]|tara:strand:+ start:1766 stop:3511 length:1746 start_codon:yes stop_codon:yes gene_type:complete
MSAQSVHIAIVGLGPKGFYGLERLLATFGQAKHTPAVHLHLFNESEHWATGWIYNPGQPDYLLMNYPNRHISIAPESPPKPLIDLPAFTEWRSKRTGRTPEEEAALIAPRNEVGHYLKQYFDELSAMRLPNLSISKHITRVTGISRNDTTFQLQTSDACVDQLCFESVLVTTGHSTSINSKLQTETPHPRHIPFVYPFSERLGHIPPGAVVACKGMGLTAIDTLLGLTEGRGGQFVETEEDGLQYRKSGDEPARILPYSRSGIPIIPRGGQTNTYTQTSFYLHNFVAQLPEGCRQLDFETEVLPYIIQDLECSYYYALFDSYGFDFNPVHNRVAFQQLQEAFHKLNPGAEAFDVNNLWFPKLEPDTDQQKAVATYWDFWLNELEQQNSAYAAAASSWRFLAKDFNKLYSAGLLSAQSEIRIQQHYFGLFNRTAYGPPVANIKKMRALMRAGILDFSYARGAELSTNPQLQLTRNSKPIAIDYSLDARIPRGFSKKASLLFNADPELFSCSDPSTGNLRCTREGHPLNAADRTETRVVLYGTPTEARLFDNDTLSREHNDTASRWAQETADRLIQKDTLIIN